MSDVFISYCRQDRELVESLASGLEQRHVSLWWDEELRRGTKPWRDEIAQAIARSRSMLVVLTESSVGRTEIQREVQLAETYRKPIIPLRVGDFPLETVVSGLVQLICIYNYVPAPGGTITAEVLDEIRARLSSGKTATEDEESEPFHHLPTLGIEAADIPRVATDRGKTILDACLEYFSRQALDGGWRDAGQILEDMKNYQVLPASMSQYHRLVEWLAWVRWYHHVSGSCRTWPEVVASLRQRLAARPDGASNLETACAPVHDRLRQGWSRVFSERCVKLHNCLYHFGPRDGSYAYSFPYLDILSADLLEPVVEALGEPFGISGEGADSLIEDARRVIGALGPGSEGPAESWDRLRGHAFPPAGAELDEWREVQDAARRREGAGSRFLGFLEHQAAAGEAPVAELLDWVRTAGDRLRSPAGIPDADSEVAPAAAAWKRGLRSLFSDPDDPEGAARAVEDLEQASRLFPAAEAHASCARAWRDGLRDRAAWLDAWVRGDVDSGAAAAIDGLARSLRGLLREVARPYCRHLGQVAGGSEPRREVREWIRRSERRLADELPAESAQVGVLRALRGGRCADAAKRISELERKRAEVLAAAGPWRELCEVMTRLDSLVAEASIPVDADGHRLAEAGPEWLEGDPDRVREMRGCVDGAARLTAAIRLGRCRGRQQLLPRLSALRESLSWVESCMASRRRVRDRLSQRDLGGALESAAELARQVPSAGDLRDGLERLSLVELRFADLHEQKAGHQWTAAARRLEELAGELDGIGGGFGAEELSRVVELRRDELRRELEECRLAEDHERRLSQALALIAGGRLEAARGLFEEMRSPLDWVASWQRAAGALERLQAALQEGADVKLLAAKVDPETGLPPEEQTLERERVRIERIQELAVEADEALGAARRSGPFDCDVDLPSATLRELEAAEGELAGLVSYQRLAQAVRGHAEEGRWQQAIRMIEDFLGGADGTGLEDPAFRLLGALRIGLQAQEIRAANLSDPRRYAVLRGLQLHHPLLSGHLRYLRRLEGPLRARFSVLRRAAERLCSLTTPVAPSDLLARLLDYAVPVDRKVLGDLEQRLAACPQNLEGEAAPPAARLKRWISELEEAAGPNLAALGAMRGDVEEAAAAARASPQDAEKVHALAVAVFCQIRERRKPPASDALAAALGVCALLACDESFRQSLLEPRGCPRAPAHPGNEPGIRERLTSEIELRFTNGRVPWGEPSDPDAWAFRWQLECGAVRQLRAADPGPLPAPYGPSLVRFLGLEGVLQSALAGSSKRRRWFGPCAVAETLRHLEEYEQALELLTQIARRRALEHEPGYMHLEDPAATLREDVWAVRCRVRTSLINRDQLAATSAAGSASEEALDRLEEHCRDVLDQLERMEEPAEAFDPFARTLQAFFQRMEKQIEQPGLFLGRPASVEEGEVRKRCMDRIIELFETRLARWRRRRRPSRTQTELLGKLEPRLGYFYRRRSGLLVDFVHMKFLRWAQAHDEDAPRGESQARLAELNELAALCVRDAPGEPAALMTQAQIRVLTAVVENKRDGLDEEIETDLDALMARSQGEAWPPNIRHGLKEMVEWVKGSAGNFANWLRQQRGVKP